MCWNSSSTAGKPAKNSDYAKHPLNRSLLEEGVLMSTSMTFRLMSVQLNFSSVKVAE